MLLVACIVWAGTACSSFLEATFAAVPGGNAVEGCCSCWLTVAHPIVVQSTLFKQLFHFDAKIE
jgi:hypothetical protein